MTSTLSILGLYDFKDGLFDNLVLPTGVDKDDFIELLCAECAELELLYPDGDLMKRLIGSWSRTNLTNWTKTYNALIDNYNPLHNFDRHEEWTDNQNNSNQSDNSGTDSVTGKQMAFNGTDFADATKQITELGTSNTTQFTGSQGHSGHLYGNIGVTTSQQMLEAEIKLRANANIYDIIIDSFKHKFCLLIY